MMMSCTVDGWGKWNSGWETDAVCLTGRRRWRPSRGWRQPQSTPWHRWWPSHVLNTQTDRETDRQTHTHTHTRKLPKHQVTAEITYVFLWPPRVADADVIFLPRGVFYLLSFFHRLIWAVADWQYTILLHMMWFWCEFRMQVWNVLHAARWNTGRKKSPKIAIWAPSHNFDGLYLRN